METIAGLLLPTPALALNYGSPVDFAHGTNNLGESQFPPADRWNGTARI